MKNIILITFLLLAVLTIGAASATDDVASDNMTVSDDVDIVAYDYDDEDEYTYYFDPNVDEEISLDPEDEDEDEITFIYLPTEAEGYVEVSTNKENIVKLDVDINDEEHWMEDEGELIGTLYIADIVDNLSKIKDGDNLTFRYYEIKNGNPELIDMFTTVCKVTLTDSTMVLTDLTDEYQYEDVEVNYPIDFEDGITIEEGWDETELIVITVNNDDLNGRVEVWINKTLAFNKALDVDVNSEEDYIISIKDLNINKAGIYEITCYFYDNNGAVKYNSTEEEDEQPILTVYESQKESVDNVTINVIEEPTVLNDNGSFIRINSSANKYDEITIHIEGKEPITIKLNNTRIDEENGDYLIGSKELNIPLTVGEYNLNITYKGKNITNKKINLISNVVITLEKDTVYSGFDDDGFVFISLKEGDITDEEGNTITDGKINLTIMDDTEIIDTIEKDIGDLLPPSEGDEDGFVIRTTDMNRPLNGKYKVIVRYFDGNEAETQVEGMVTFKTLTAKDYGTSINPAIKDENDSVITFKNLPLIDNIRVEIDGTEVDYDAYIEELYEQEGNYSIKFDKLEGLTEGSHKISVYLVKNILERLELANGTVFIDVEENIDLNLTISVANIEEGNVATVVITTNNNFTGAIAVQIGASNYSVNVVKGQGSIPVASLKANTYTATALFKSDGIFNDATKTATFKVTAKPVTPSTPSTPTTPAAPAKKVIKLTLKKVKVKKSAKKLVLKATLKINGKAPKKGTKIKFTFKGKKYIGKTNKKGVAKVTIKKKVLKKLKVGKKVKYTAKYSTKTVKRTAKVKR